MCSKACREQVHDCPESGSARWRWCCNHIAAHRLLKCPWRLLALTSGAPQCAMHNALSQILLQCTGNRLQAHLWHQVTMMMRPPGAVTRASSPTNRGFSGMCSPLSSDHTRSKAPSSKGCCSASATCLHTWDSANGQVDLWSCTLGHEECAAETCPGAVLRQVLQHICYLSAPLQA